jgi:hypothetical protein
MNVEDVYCIGKNFLTFFFVFFPLFSSYVSKAKECIDSFFFYNGHIFVNFLRICGFNRARQRDKIARLLDNFASLQDEVNMSSNSFLNVSHKGAKFC